MEQPWLCNYVFWAALTFIQPAGEGGRGPMQLPCYYRKYDVFAVFCRPDASHQHIEACYLRVPVVLEAPSSQQQPAAPGDAIHGQVESQGPVGRFEGLPEVRHERDVWIVTYYTRQCETTATTVAAVDSRAGANS